jgi:hypothetical protein
MNMLSLILSLITITVLFAHLNFNRYCLTKILIVFSRVPIQTIFDTTGSEEGGVVAVGMTPDARYLATLSAAKTQVRAQV